MALQLPFSSLVQLSLSEGEAELHLSYIPVCPLPRKSGPQSPDISRAQANELEPRLLLFLQVESGQYQWGDREVAWDMGEHPHIFGFAFLHCKLANLHPAQSKLPLFSEFPFLHLQKRRVKPVSRCCFRVKDYAQKGQSHNQG